MFPALGALLGLLHPVAGVVIQRGLKFQTCTNTLNKFFITIPGIFGSPHVHVCNFIICLCCRLLVRSAFSYMTQMNQKICIHMRVHSLVIQPKLTPKNLITKHSRTTRILLRGSVTWNREKCCIFLPSGGIMFGHSAQVSLLVSGGHDHVYV